VPTSQLMVHNSPHSNERAVKVQILKLTVGYHFPHLNYFTNLHFTNRCNVWSSGTSNRV